MLPETPDGHLQPATTCQSTGFSLPRNTRPSTIGVGVGVGIGIGIENAWRVVRDA